MFEPQKGAEMHVDLVQMFVCSSMFTTETCSIFARRIVIVFVYTCFEWTGRR